MAQSAGVTKHRHKRRIFDQPPNHPTRPPAPRPGGRVQGARLGGLWVVKGYLLWDEFGVVGKVVCEIMGYWLDVAGGPVNWGSAPVPALRGRSPRGRGAGQQADQPLLPERILLGRP